MTIALPVLVVLVLGLLMFFLIPSPSGKEVGRLMFFAGLLVFLFKLAGSLHF